MYSPPTPCTNPMQVVYVSKKHGFVTLYITATDKDECADWVANIRQGMLYQTPSHKCYSCLWNLYTLLGLLCIGLLECSGEHRVFYHPLWVLLSNQRIELEQQVGMQ